MLRGQLPSEEVDKISAWGGHPVRPPSALSTGMNADRMPELHRVLG